MRKVMLTARSTSSKDNCDVSLETLLRSVEGQRSPSIQFIMEKDNASFGGDYRVGPEFVPNSVETPARCRGLTSNWQAVGTG